MAETYQRCAYHFGNRATFVVPENGYFIRGKVERVALCPMCVRKLHNNQLEEIPHHFMPEHRPNDHQIEVYGQSN